MRQVIQDLRSGATVLAEVPCPAVKRGHLLIRARASLISPGTERTLVEFGRANWLARARQQPERVRQTLDKVKADGLMTTVDAVRARLAQPLPLGYCSAGVVAEVGDGVEGFAVGERVASNGYHAEIVQIPKTLAARIPRNVSDEAAAFTVAGAVALEGIRLLAPTLGETFAVIGLGLVGQLTIQLLRANGCSVVGVDLDCGRLQLAQRFGAIVCDLSAGHDPVRVVAELSRAAGVDGAIVSAATNSNEPISLAAKMCRKRGRIVLVGDTGLKLHRADFYQKELTFQVSCSYGPGRYDAAYEVGGHDYPIGFVRWTAQRNFESVLSLISEGKLGPLALISHRFPLDRAAEAYELITRGNSSLGVIIQYPGHDDEHTTRRTLTLLSTAPAAAAASLSPPVIGAIGAGNFATSTLLPAFRLSGARLKTIASRGGLDCAHAGRRFGCERATTDLNEVFGDPEICAVVIATRHDTHAALVGNALAAGKHVFVEKPLAITRDELRGLARLMGNDSPRAPLLMVGFNRRFAPHAVRMKSLLEGTAAPRNIVITVNAGAPPAEHWTSDRAVAGGRIIGEVCHFIDLARFLAGSPIVEVSANGVDSVAGESVGVTIRFRGGSLATISYMSNGHRSFPKESVLVFCAGRVLALDNFRRLRGYGWPGFRRLNLWRQDKGHVAEAAAFVAAVERGDRSPIAPEELFEVAEATFSAAEAIRKF